MRYPDKKLEKLKEYLSEDKFLRTNEFTSMIAVIASRLNSMLNELERKKSSYRQIWLSISDDDKIKIEAEFEKQNI